MSRVFRPGLVAPGAGPSATRGRAPPSGRGRRAPCPPRIRQTPGSRPSGRGPDSSSSPLPAAPSRCSDPSHGGRPRRPRRGRRTWPGRSRRSSARLVLGRRTGGVRAAHVPPVGAGRVHHHEPLPIGQAVIDACGQTAPLAAAVQNEHHRGGPAPGPRPGCGMKYSRVSSPTPISRRSRLSGTSGLGESGRSGARGGDYRRRAVAGRRTGRRAGAAASATANGEERG